MAEQKESSVLFSLKELMNLEQERISQEAANQQRQAREARERRESEERAAREAEERRVRDAEEARRAEEQRSREDAARVEAIKQAELERAKTEAEHRARLQAEAAQREHEAQLVKIRQQSSARRTKIVASAAITLLAIAIAGLVFKWKQDQDLAARERNRAAEDFARLKEEADRIRKEREQLEQQYADAKAEQRRAQEALDNAKSAAERDAARALKAQSDERVKGLEARTGAKSPRPKTTAPKCNCTPGDPLCSCL